MRKNYGFLYTAPSALAMTVLLVAPSLIILIFSFLAKDPNAGVAPRFSLEAYQSLFRADYGRVLADTLYITALSSAIAIAAALPCAYYMALARCKTLLLFIVIIPFWTNFLVRIFAWKAILEANGFLNLILLKTGIIETPVIFLYNRAAVIIVLAYTYLPFAILPLYSTIEKFDFSLLEAARDLGCTHMQSLRKVLLPCIRGGILTALAFVFIPIFGQYVVPDLIGGGRDGTFMLGQKIANAFFKERNWPLPAAFATLLTGFTALFMLGFAAKQRKRSKAKSSLNAAAGNTERALRARGPLE